MIGVPRGAPATEADARVGLPGPSMLLHTVCPATGRRPPYVRTRGGGPAGPADRDRCVQRGSDDERQSRRGTRPDDERDERQRDPAGRVRAGYGYSEPRPVIILTVVISGEINSAVLGAWLSSLHGRVAWWPLAISRRTRWQEDAESQPAQSPVSALALDSGTQHVQNSVQPSTVAGAARALHQQAQINDDIDSCVRCAMSESRAHHVHCHE